MDLEKKGGVSNYQYNSFTRDQLTDADLVGYLCDFYNKATKKENTDRVYTPDEFSTDVLQATIQANGGRIVYARDGNSQVCGFVAGYNTNFNQKDFQLETPVPEGTYFYLFGLANSTQDPTVLFGLTTTLLEDLKADYCVGLVSHEAPIYKKRVYPLRGWTEIKSGLPIAQGKSYFYIPRQEVIR